MKTIVNGVFALFLYFILSGMNHGAAERELFNEQDTLYYSSPKEKLSTYERSFKPSYYDTEVYLFKKNDTTKTVAVALDQTYALPETTQGFRVQLFSSNLYDEATAFKNNVNTLFPELWVY
ncbi:MAG: hypothetical protein H3C35_12025, partial [Bacteroidetes bacterium]|nr:hypothetical protein [Bacteroidota bacterium]